MPNTSGYSRTDYINLANILGIKYKINGSGNIITTNLNEGDIITKETLLEINFQESEENAGG